MEGQLSFFETKSQVKKYSKTVSVDRIPVGKKLKVISLFSGCGGMDLGFRGGFSVFGRNFDRNPFEIVFANDIVKKACDTYTYNFS